MRPVPVLRWSLRTVRRIEAIRDRIQGICGSGEPAIEADDFPPGHQPVSRQWRWPLLIEEVAQMAPDHGDELAFETNSRVQGQGPGPDVAPER